MPAALPEIRLVESQPTVVQLTDHDATLLRQLGRELTSNRTWWGGSGASEDRSIVLVDQLSIERYRITFRDVVGVVRLPNLQINVAPKISIAHFLYIVGHSEVVPRHSTAHVQVDQGTGFIEVLARWFLDAAERLMRNGLRKDYCEHTEELSEVRGSLDPCETALAAASGRAIAFCNFDELSYPSGEVILQR